MCMLKIFCNVLYINIIQNTYFIYLNIRHLQNLKLSLVYFLHATWVNKDGHLLAEKGGGWNNAAGKQYVPYGRRIFGPYFHRDFGGVSEIADPKNPIGEAIFWCRVPAKTRLMSTLVWNPSSEILLINIKINESLIPEIAVQAGEYKVIESKIPEYATDLKIGLTGDRRLVILQTSFE